MLYIHAKYIYIGCNGLLCTLMCLFNHSAFLYTHILPVFISLHMSMTWLFYSTYISQGYITVLSSPQSFPSLPQEQHHHYRDAHSLHHKHEILEDTTIQNKRSLAALRQAFTKHYNTPNDAESQ